MTFEQIEAAEAIEKATTGQQSFMLIPIHPGTTLQEMDEAVGYVAPILPKKPGPKAKPKTDSKTNAKSGRKSKIDDKELAKLYREGETLDDLAKHFETAAGTVKDHLKKLGIWEPQGGQIDKGMVGALYEGGWPLTEIAAEMKTSESKIIEVLKEKGLYADPKA